GLPSVVVPSTSAAVRLKSSRNPGRCTIGKFGLLKLMGRTMSMRRLLSGRERPVGLVFDPSNTGLRGVGVVNIEIPRRGNVDYANWGSCRVGDKPVLHDAELGPVGRVEPGECPVSGTVRQKFLERDGDAGAGSLDPHPARRDRLSDFGGQINPAGRRLGEI